jgi:hypothetical protein
MFISSSVLACSTCANAFKHAGQDAAGWSIAVMLMVIVPLAVCVLWFMIKIAKREKAGLDSKYCDDYIPPSVAPASNH